jgi:hypothetical protein
MRRVLWSACVGAMVVALHAPAARADTASVLDAFRRLDLRSLSPAPLIPVALPARLRPIEDSFGITSTVHRGAYAWLLRHYRPSGSDAIIAFSAGDFRNMRAVKRGLGRSSRSPIRVRGRRGVLFTRRIHPLERFLVWSEGGRINVMGSGTPRTVSLKGLLTTAAGLEPLGHYYIGGSDDPNLSSGADIGTTAHTVTVHLEFSADCGSTPYGGQAEVAMAPLRGNSFSFDIAKTRTDSLPWTGTFSGTIDADTATLRYQVSGTVDGRACSGAETFTLPRNRFS